MDNFKYIYKILRYLEQSMDCAYFELSPISHTALGISRERWERLLIMLQKNGYIEGLSVVQTMSDATAHIVDEPQMAITLKGLEYLYENSVMKKVGDVLKGVVSVMK